MVGDPRQERHPSAVSEEAIKHNALTPMPSRRSRSDPAKTRIEYNSTRLSELGATGMIKLAAKQTVACMMERDDFKKRYNNGQSIAIHEFLYPLPQAMTGRAGRRTSSWAVPIRSSTCVDGSRAAKDAGMATQCVLMMPLLVGLDGVKKMSKSAANYIGVHDARGDVRQDHVHHRRSDVELLRAALLPSAGRD